MIAKTKTLNNLVFFPLVTVSLIMTIWLFYQFGSNVVSSVLLCIIGAGIEAFKILSLIRWKNQKLLNRKRQYSPLFLYTVMAVASCFASLAFGIKEIEKVSAIQMTDTGRGEVIQMRISQLTKQAGHKNSTYITGLQRQIETLKGQIPTRGISIIKKTKEINDEISKLNEQIKKAAQVKDNAYIHNQIEKLKKEYAHVRLTTIDTKGTFAIVADAFGIKTETIMIIFLTFVTIIIEVGIASTSATVATSVRKAAKKTDEAGKSEKPKKVKREKPRLFKQ
jgi:hypothetical protein